MMSHSRASQLDDEQLHQLFTKRPSRTLPIPARSIRYDRQPRGRRLSDDEMLTAIGAGGMDGLRDGAWLLVLGEHFSLVSMTKRATTSHWWQSLARLAELSWCTYPTAIACTDQCAQELMPMLEIEYLCLCILQHAELEVALFGRKQTGIKILATEHLILCFVL